MEITKEQIEQLKKVLDADYGHSAHYIRIEIKNNIIPELFKLQPGVGKWYKYTSEYHDYLICVTNLIYDKYFKGSITQEHYGFVDGEFKINESWCNTDFSLSMIEATESEVFEALKKEAIKRGLWNVKIKSAMDGFVCDMNCYDECYSLESGTLWSSFGRVFYQGKWATIADQPEEMTIEQIQKELGKKIKIVE